MSEFRGSVLDPTIIDEPKTQIEFSGNGGSNTPPGLPGTINGSPDYPSRRESKEVVNARFGAIVSRLDDVAAFMDKIASEDGDGHTTEPSQNVVDASSKFTPQGLDETAKRGTSSGITSLRNYKNIKPRTL